MISILKACIWVLASSLLLMPVTAAAQPKALTRDLAASDLEPWLDGFMQNAISVNEVQGAVVAVVKEGKVITQRGYGYADAARSSPVDAENTMFRPGSISKLFVWTSIMQLVEQGKIDLDEDINTYLDFKIVGMGGKKITVRHLMTHRAGFEEYGKSGIFSDPALLRPLGIFLKTYVPKRIFAPGTTPAYSNYGASVAGYIVQRVSGMPFETYVERNIFTPLGMTHSTFRQPLPKALQPFMSKGYDVAGGDAQPFELINDVPAGALSASTADMVRFMIAHLAAERGVGGKLLKPETAKLMHRSSIKNFTALNGMALGFYQDDKNGRKIIAHGGDLELFHSDMSLLIDDGIGIYISMNSAGNNAFSIRNKLLDQFVDRYMPNVTRQDSIAPDLAKAHIAQVAGAYVSTRRIDSSFGSLINLFSELSISTDGKGLLILEGPAKPLRFREIQPFLWQEEGGKEMLAVKMKDGRPVAMALNSVASIMEFTPVAPLRSAAVMVPVMLAALAVLTLSILMWPFSIFAKRFYGVVWDQKADEQRLLLTRRLGSISLIVSIIFWLAMIIPRVSGFSEADNAQILMTQTISILCALITAMCVVLTIRGLFMVRASRLRTFGTLVWLAASIYVIWFMYSFNFFKIGTDI